MTAETVIVKEPTSWKNGKYKTKRINTTNKSGEEYGLDIYDFSKFCGSPSVQIKLMEDKPSRDDIHKYNELSQKPKEDLKPNDVKAINKVECPRRALVINLYGDNGVEQGFWLNLHPIKTKRRKLKNGTSTSYLTWEKVNGKNEGINAAFKDKGAYPEFDALNRDATGFDWIKEFRSECDKEFGKNSYKVIPYGTANFNRTAIPFVGAAVSDLGRGDKFMIKIGSHTLIGKFRDFEDCDIKFGKDSGWMRCIGWFDNKQEF